MLTCVCVRFDFDMQLWVSTLAAFQQLVKNTEKINNEASDSILSSSVRNEVKCKCFILNHLALCVLCPSVVPSQFTEKIATNR